MSKNIHRDVWLGSGLLVFCAVVLALATKISGQAAYLPVALTILMGLCAVFIIIKGLSLTRAQQGKGDFKYSLTIKESKNAFLFMLFIFVYYFLFRYISYWVATPVFLIFSMKHLKVKSWKVNIIITVLYMIISYILFVVVLQLPIYKVGVLGRYFRFV